MCILSVYICIAKSCWLLLFEWSVHVSDGFHKKIGMVGGWGELYQFIFGIVLTLQIP